jgi:hypothetical protein
MGTQLSTPPLVTAIPVLTVTGQTPSNLESATAEATVVIEQTVSAPSGLRVVYLREGNLWLWTEAGGNVMLTGTADLTAMRLSKDGQSLAFMRGPEVWTIRMDGTDARLLVIQDKEGGALSFSPDGSYLAVSTADHIDAIDLKSGTHRTQRWTRRSSCLCFLRGKRPV